MPLVEDAEGTRFELEQRDQKRQRCQRLLTAGEKQDILQLLAGRLGYDFDTRVTNLSLIDQA